MEEDSAEDKQPEADLKAHDAVPDLPPLPGSSCVRESAAEGIAASSAGQAELCGPSLPPRSSGAELYGSDEGDELLASELRREFFGSMKSRAKVLGLSQEQKELKVLSPRDPKKGPEGDKA